MIIVLDPRIVSDFLCGFIKCSQEQCWPWVRATNGQGYGVFTVERRTYKAHRISYLYYVGPFDQDLDIMHSCDNTSCINPGHLSPGTRLRNVRDMFSKGRQAIRPQDGQNNANSRLTQMQIDEIRAISDQYTRAELSEKFDISRPHLSKILSYKAW